ncbi:hypothetical protein M407DRAFT_243149 [Tulasnella calospora MUT 4182]|uniref:Uncharacterized protein n=1 Tax=Tulasnella calospora MUT 4182 TaxID=1051891 RepID=A0A0C3QMQ5_9AGAM|nr:hypothetical protein M407DRAFT_243149 [Tulasnella calospora MUT 4182]
MKKAAVNPTVITQSPAYVRNSLQPLLFTFSVLIDDCRGADTEKPDEPSGVGLADHWNVGIGG